MTFGTWTSAVRVACREDETLITNVVGTDQRRFSARNTVVRRRVDADNYADHSCTSYYAQRGGVKLGAEIRKQPSFVLVKYTNHTTPYRHRETEVRGVTRDERYDYSITRREWLKALTILKS